MTAKVLTGQIEVFFTIEGKTKHFSAPMTQESKVSDLVIAAERETKFESDPVVYLEDGEFPLSNDAMLLTSLGQHFAPLHIATGGAILVLIQYNNREAKRSFPPSTTIGRIIVWAIGRDGLSLEGDSSDYQLKRDGQVLSPDQHLGQIARGHKTVDFDLVFNVKPQG